MQTDILIVGGGLSGLALADRLAREGTDFRLYEAQDRLGGRIMTKEIAGGRFDLGPTWFWPGQPRMADLAHRFNIPVFEQFSSGDPMFQDQTGAVHRGRGYASMQGSFRLAGGMGALIDALSKGLDPTMIRTATRLISVAQHVDGVTAVFEQGDETLTVIARHIVLAMPPRVIAETVKFEPVLSAGQLQSLKNVPTWMAGQAKILAVYDEPYWRKAGLSGDAMSHRGPMVEVHDASPIEGGPYALFGFVGISAEIRAAHRSEIEQDALSQLSSLFGPKMARPRALIFQDWAALPEITRPQDRTPVRNHPSYGLPKNLSGLAAQGIHFASTETAWEFGGFLEGALEAAEGTAKQLGLAGAV